MMVFKVFVLCVAMIFICHGEIEMKGMTFTADRYCKEVPFDSERGLRSLEHIASTGANWVSLVVTWYQLTATSDDIYPINRPFQHLDDTPGFWNYTHVSETGASVVRAIRKAHSLGLKVLLKPHIDLVEDAGGNAWRGNIVAATPKWWSSYTKMMLMWAKIAQKERVAMLSVSCELVGASFRTQEWRTLIARVREVYDGKLTAAANWAPPGGGGELTSKAYWDALDYIGVDEYMPLPSGAASVESIVQAWQPLVQQYKQLSDQYGKPFLITEVGYCDGPNCQVTQHDTPEGQEEQARHYEALLQVLWSNAAWLKGVFWWNWVSDSAFRNHECMDIKWTKAEDVLRRYYNATKPQPPQPTEQPACVCTL